MPIYEYVCNKCKKAFEFFHLRQDEVAECPECKSKEVTKQVSAPDHVINGASAKNNYGLKKF
jgi:putative FmdB family regulatory protein